MRVVATNLRFATLAIAMASIVTLQGQRAEGGGLVRSAAVGGVSIDAEGVMANPEVGSLEEITTAGQAHLDQIPSDLQKSSELRFVSLRRIEAILAEKAAAGLKVPDEVQLMAGLQRVKYVLAYPEQGDILLAGPAEGWKLDRLGNVVGSTTNRPVVALDDFMVALRAARERPGEGMSCSIDPTPEGMRRAQEVSRQLGRNESPRDVAQRMAEAIGYQTITLTGVADTSHFARTMVAADYRMKRLAMNFEPAPIAGMPSYVQMIQGSRRGTSAGPQPRWWLASNYEPLLRDKEGLAWEIRGQGVKCMTAEDFFDEKGQRKETRAGNSAAQKWADQFTAKFEDLAAHDSSFGHLRNVMDLAVITTVIVHQDLEKRVGLETPYLSEKQPLEVFPAPKRVATQTTYVGRVVTASGGVQIVPAEILENEESVDRVAVASEAAKGLESADGWWWDAR